MLISGCNQEIFQTRKYVIKTLYILHFDVSLTLTLTKNYLTKNSLAKLPLFSVPRKDYNNE